MKLNKLTAILLFLVLAGGVALWSAGYLHLGKTVPVADADHAHEPESAAESGHGHEEMTPETKCEHGIATIDCAECRYELGVVKVDPKLAGNMLETSTVAQIPNRRILKLTGAMELDRTRRAEIAPSGSGRVQEIRKQLGDKVKAGEILAVLQSPDLGEAQARLLETRAEEELALANFEREKRLQEKQVGSLADYQEAQRNLRAARAQAAAAEKRLYLFGLAEAEIKNLGREPADGSFARLHLTAPLDGVVIEQELTLGKLVLPDQTVITVADLSKLWLWCDIYPKDLAPVQQALAQAGGLKATVRVPGLSPEFTGTADLLDSRLDEHTRTARLRIQMANLQGSLKPNMFAEVSLEMAAPGQVTAVPRNALLNDEGKFFVFEQLHDDFWIRRDVVPGERMGDLLEIKAGLTPGKTIVCGGAFMLKSDILREKMGAGCAD